MPAFDPVSKNFGNPRDILPAFAIPSAQVVPDPSAAAVLVQVPRSTSARKCCLSVLRLAPVSLMASPMVTRPCSRANSTI